MPSRRRPILRARTAALFAAAVAFATAAEAAGPAPGGASGPVATDGPRQVAPVDLSGEPPLQTRRITPRGESPAASPGRSGLPSTGSALSALAVVVLLILAVARLWKTHGPKLPNAVPQQAAEVLGRCRIEPRQSLYLVRLGSRVLVIGSSGGELAALSEVTDPIEVDLIVGQCRAGNGGASPFSRLFTARQTDTAETAPTPAVPRWPSDAAEEADHDRPSRPTPEQRLADRFRRRPPVEEAGRVV